VANTASLICWTSEDGYAIQIRLQDPAGKPITDEILVELDTGYSGDLLVPWEVYMTAELFGWELPESEWKLGIMLSGQWVDMPQSEATIEIPALNQAFPVRVDTFTENTEFLIGRNFLKNHRVLLDGPGHQVCFLPEETP
jgi:hypothetical protein